MGIQGPRRPFRLFGAHGEGQAPRKPGQTALKAKRPSQPPAQPEGHPSVHLPAPMLKLKGEGFPGLRISTSPTAPQGQPWAL